MDEVKLIKVCFVSPKSYLYFFPVEGISPGGAERQMYYIGNKLSENENFDIHYLVADYGQKEKIKKVEKLSLWKSFSFSENKAVALVKLFRTLAKIKASVYVLRASDPGVFFVTMFVRFFLHRKVVYMIAAQYEADPKNLKAETTKTTALLMKYVYKFANVLTAQAKYQVSDFLKYRNISINNIQRNIYKSSTKREPKSDYKRSTILWVGRCIPLKRPEIYISLAEKFPDETFVMICPAATNKKEYFYEIKEKAQNVNNLEFIDFVEPDQIGNYFRNAKIYTITSTLEGFANTMMEAMDARCAILSLDINPDNILHEFNMGLCANDITEYFENFRKLDKNPKLCKEMGDGGKKYLEKYHNEDNETARFVKIIENLVRK